MSNRPSPLVLAVAGLRSVEVVDVVAVSLPVAGGHTVGLLLPLSVVGALLSHLASALDHRFDDPDLVPPG